MRGGKRTGAGRKAGPNPLQTSKTIRWNTDEWDEVEAAAERAKESVSEFVRTAALSKARENNNE